MDQRDQQADDELGPVWTSLLTAMTASDPADRPSASQVREAIGSVWPPNSAAPTVRDTATPELRPPASTALLTGVTPEPEAGSRGRRAPVWAAAGVIAAGAVAVGIVLATNASDPVAPARPGTTVPAVAASPGATTPVTADATPPAIPSAIPSATPPGTTVVQTSAATPTPSAAAATTAATGPADSGGGRPEHTPPGQTKSHGKDTSKG